MKCPEVILWFEVIVDMMNSLINNMKRYLLLICYLLFVIGLIQAQDFGAYKLVEEIPYYPDAVSDTNSYIKERCVLDIYYPKDIPKYATLIWFHGGGLTGGSKQLPEGLRDKGFAVIGVNYRLHPKVSAVLAIDDAAAAVAWVFDNIEDYGGDSTKIFISGHSAGGYLTSMVGMNPSYLAKYGIDANRVAGLLPLSGHTITHFTIRKERGIDGTQPIVDDLAPLFFVRKDAPPLVLITGDRELELLGRYEENAYMYRMMKVVGHEQTYLHEIKDIGHGMAHLAFPLVVDYINKIQME